MSQVIEAMPGSVVPLAMFSFFCLFSLGSDVKMMMIAVYPRMPNVHFGDIKVTNRPLYGGSDIVQKRGILRFVKEL